MAKEKSEIIQQVEDEFSLLHYRRNAIKTGINKLRNDLLNYFLDSRKITALAEIDGNFDLSLMSSKMNQFLRDEQKILASVESYADLNAYIDVFHSGLIRSELFIVYDGTRYQFQPITFHPPKANQFMQQLAAGLTLYRLYLDIYACYLRFLNYDFIAINPHKDSIRIATSLSTRAIQNIPAAELLGLFQSAKELNKATKNSFKTLHQGIAEFKNDLSIKLPLVKLLKNFTTELKQYYHAKNEFSWNNDWHNMLQSLANGIFNKHFSVDSNNHETMIANLITEIDKFNEVMLEKIPFYKAELIQTTLTLTNTTLLKIRKEAAIQNILLSPTAQQFFYEAKPNSVSFIGEPIVTHSIKG